MQVGYYYYFFIIIIIIIIIIMIIVIVIFTSESDPHSYVVTWAFTNKALKKLHRDSNPWATLYVIPAWCSTNWAMKPHWKQVKSEFNLWTHEHDPHSYEVTFKSSYK